jgi:hypothetical protein
LDEPFLISWFAFPFSPSKQSSCYYKICFFLFLIMFLSVPGFIFIFIIYYILGCLLSHTHHMWCVVWLDLKPNTYIHTYSMTLIIINTQRARHRTSMMNLVFMLYYFLSKIYKYQTHQLLQLNIHLLYILYHAEYDKITTWFCRITIVL